MNDNESLEVYSTELANVDCSKTKKVTKVAYLPSSVSEDEHCVLYYHMPREFPCVSLSDYSFK